MNLFTAWKLRQELDWLVKIVFLAIFYIAFPPVHMSFDVIIIILVAILAYNLIQYWSIPNTYPVWICVQRGEVYYTPEIAKSHLEKTYDMEFTMSKIKYNTFTLTNHTQEFLFVQTFLHM